MRRSIERLTVSAVVALLAATTTTMTSAFAEQRPRPCHEHGQAPELAAPGEEAHAWFNGYDLGDADNQITWAFDPSVPAETQAYILAFWADVVDEVDAIVGLPSANITVTIVYDPNLPYGGAYYYGQNRLVFHTLPVGYNVVFFNATFVHEAIHAYTDAALERGFVSWTAEGTAVAGTALVAEAIGGQHGFSMPYRTLGEMSVFYDSLSQMGAGAIGGQSILASNLSGVHSYSAAGGLWWLLTSSQSSATAGDWLGNDYLASFFAAIFAADRSLLPADVLATLDETAALTIDGQAADAWTAAQPVAQTNANGEFVFAVLDTPVLTPNCASNLLVQPFRRQNGVITRHYGLSVTIRARDLANVERWTTTIVPQPSFGGYQAVPVGAYLKSTPGAYVIEIDASAFGSPIQRITALNAGDAYCYLTGASIATPTCFYDALAGSVVTRLFTLQGAYLAGQVAGAYRFMPLQIGWSPSSFTLTTAGLVGKTFKRTNPLPYRRVLRFDVLP